MQFKDKLLSAKQFISQKIPDRPHIGIVLGSGLGSLADAIENPVVMEYRDIPYFPSTSIQGHEGQLVFGMLGRKYVMVMKGRVHVYEGHCLEHVTFGIRLMHSLGVDTVIMTNACGGMRDHMYLGALMLIEDHVNLTYLNPLVGMLEPGKERFLDLSDAYDASLIHGTKDLAKSLGIKVISGIYGAITGPHYLATAELKMLRRLGADVVGMSTVHEVIVARHLGMRVLGLSCVTDMSVPEAMEPIDHDMVVRVANQTKPKILQLVTGIIQGVIK
jgi:purine-nucleoside phosphorylase